MLARFCTSHCDHRKPVDSHCNATQPRAGRFNSHFPHAGNRKFLFGSQTWDNVFYNFVSGVTIWTAFEVVSMWAYANGWLPWVEFRTNLVYCVVMFPLIVLFRQVHFYATHRLTHWKPYYRAAHYVHHKNVNPGPWSGFSMHPLGTSSTCRAS